MSAKFFVKCESIKSIAEERIKELELDIAREPQNSREAFERKLKQDTLELTMSLLNSGRMAVSHTAHSLSFMRSFEVGVPIAKRNTYNKKPMQIYPSEGI